MPFEHTVTARFFEIDRAGIVFFARFFEYCHEAFEEFLAASFGTSDNFFASTSWGIPLVHSEASFVRPVHLGERLKITMHLERLGDRSVTFVYDVCGEDGQSRATVRLVHAFIDRDTFSGRDVPDEFRAALVRGGLLDSGDVG